MSTSAVIITLFIPQPEGQPEWRRKILATFPYVLKDGETVESVTRDMEAKRLRDGGTHSIEVRPSVNHKLSDTELAAHDHVEPSDEAEDEDEE